LALFYSPASSVLKRTGRRKDGTNAVDVVYPHTKPDFSNLVVAEETVGDDRTLGSRRNRLAEGEERSLPIQAPISLLDEKATEGRESKTHLPRHPLFPSYLPKLSPDASDGHRGSGVVCETKVEEVGRDAVFDFCSKAVARGRCERERR
jgi:hypothetical protein